MGPEIVVKNNFRKKLSKEQDIYVSNSSHLYCIINLQNGGREFNEN